PAPVPVPIPAPAPARGDDAPTAATDAWAVIGLGGRYPYADDLDAFWTGALHGPAVTALPPVRRSRTVADDGPDAAHDGCGVGRVGGGAGCFVRDADVFDPEFFGLTAGQAAAADPQERLLLEVAFDTLERAGYTGARLDRLRAADGEPRSLGVFAALGGPDHAVLSGTPAAPATARLLSGRLPALLDLRGPHQTTAGGGPTAFLAALHQALGALRAGECAAALVGAADLRLHPDRHVPGGGEGAGAVLIRPLAAARASGDRVHAVVRFSAVVHQGRGGPATARARIARALWRASGIDARAIALEEDVHTAARRTGDAGAAAGAAAVTLAVLQLAHTTLAPGAAPRPWPAPGPNLPRRAGVSAQGGDGTCARVVLEEAPTPAQPTVDRLAGPVSDRPACPVADPPAGSDAWSDPPGGQELVLLSAPTPEHLTATARRFAAWAARLGAGGPSLARVARELRTGRTARACRLAVTAHGMPELAAALADFARTGTSAAGALPGDPARGARGPGDRAPVPPLEDLPETRAYVAALWGARRHGQLARLWLAGVDVTAVEPEPTSGPTPYAGTLGAGGVPPEPQGPPGPSCAVVALPPSALLGRPLPLGDGGRSR
ncbi:polyketide synthase, partial [Streptomyces mangrovisoli]